MSDMEQRLRDAFAAKAESVTNASLTPSGVPEADATVVKLSTARRTLNRAWLPILVAAAVAAVIAGSLGFVSNAQSQHRGPAASNSVDVDTPVPTSTSGDVPNTDVSSTSPAATSSDPETKRQDPGSTVNQPPVSNSAPPTGPTGPTATAPTTAWDDPSQYPNWKFVDPGVSVPDGWTIGSGEIANAAGTEEWCVQPAQPTGYAGCAIRLYEVQKKDSIDVTWLEGFPGVGSQTMDGMYCTHTGANATAQLTVGTRNFGGRSADYRQWTVHCDNGRVLTPTHYVVADYPGFVLVTNGDLTSETTALDWMAAHAVLPTS